MKAKRLDDDMQKKPGQYILRTDTSYNKLICKVANIIAECISVEDGRLRNLPKISP